MTSKEKERYWSKVTVLSADECWFWTGARFKPSGYGAFWLGDQNRLAHRVSYSLANDCELETEQIIRHRCDNRLCQNPRHLLLGTQADNMADMSERHRSLRGSRNPISRLTDEEVRDIADRYAKGNVSQEALAERFGVNKATIGRVLRGATWTDTDRTDTAAVLMARKSGEAKAHRGEAGGLARLTDDQVRQIRQRYAAGGVTQQQLALEYNVDRTNVSAIIRRKTWTHITEQAENLEQVSS